MTLNEFINNLQNIRDTYNAGDYMVMTKELVYDVICGEIDNVYGEPYPINENNYYVDKNNKMLHINFVDNHREI